MRRAQPILVLAAIFLAAAIGACKRDPPPAVYNPAARQGTGVAGNNPPRPATSPAATTKPVAAINRVILISVDGLRPDMISRAGCVNIAELIDTGVYTLWARTSDVPFTLPSHASMLTGVRPARHGIKENEYTSDNYPAVPTIFDAARSKGLMTAFVAGKSKLKVLCRPNSIVHDFADDQTDEQVAERASDVLTRHKPELLVVHFRGADYAGHFDGWGSPRQIAALRIIDAGVGRILTAVKSAGMESDTAVLLTADHGGAGNTHWEDVRSTTIPWIIRGPGLLKGFDLDRLGGTTIRTEDTFATIAWLLQLPTYPDIDGRPVTDIVSNPATELLYDD